MNTLQDRLNIVPDIPEPAESAEHDYTGITQTGSGLEPDEVQLLDSLVGGARLELATNGLKVRCSTG
jgi:hypothetical protein